MPTNSERFSSELSFTTELLALYSANGLPFVFQCASPRFLASFFSRLAEVATLPKNISKITESL